MTIKLLTIGKTDDAALQNLIDTYVNRLGHYNRFEPEIIPDLKKTKNLSVDQQKTAEGKLILDKLNTSDFVVLLDENGKQFSSEGFSEYIQKRLNSGMKQLIFIIGGPYGFSEELYSRADGKLSLSKMTFSHQMVRLFFVEQLYRAFTILKNEPYHHK
ncbi:23S rRNA (pseudouridine(1915)-N(3))-methyltransferase RlmH [Salinimicrobium xinjiangense]|uniref:23S rRNA (pseudouridine(1915)-N(3))-methyltransferase RlmH n=1 Tax=Salinimicrobium xinjiangense TaxID=438596 RepID=UPI0004185997|nr:23S rRNA (pseudouridine(1915)-N(3))-methyltransferase RlmH [Salinimicrobium xinjiangense]